MRRAGPGISTAFTPRGTPTIVVDLMVGKLTRLTAETQKAVQQLACLGNAAAVATLSLVCGTTETEIHSICWTRRFALTCWSGGRTRTTSSTTAFKRRPISLIPESLRAEAHLRIGRLLAAHTPPEQREEAIYEIVNQLNRGAPLITSDQEREQVAELNLIAGKRAKAATAYASALNYLVTGAALLPEDCWESGPTRLRDGSRSRRMRIPDGCIWPRQKSGSRRCPCALRISWTRPRSRACERSLHDARSCRPCRGDLRRIPARAGVDWSPHPTDEEVSAEYERLWAQLGSRPIEALFDLPLMTDPDWRATMEVLTELVGAGVFLDENLCVPCPAANGEPERRAWQLRWVVLRLWRLGYGRRRPVRQLSSGFPFRPAQSRADRTEGPRPVQSPRVSHARALAIPWGRHVRAGVRCSAVAWRPHWRPATRRMQPMR